MGVTTGAPAPSVPATGRTIDVRRVGVMPYLDALALQTSLVEDRRAGRIPDTLLLLQHPPVVTLGSRTRGQTTHIIASPTTLDAAGVSVYESGRGGDVTYHGPGQLVGYPILDLRPDRCDVHQYVRDLEAVLIRAIAHFGVVGGRVVGSSGVWVGEPGREEKIAAIGVRISRWITSHGFALNVTPNLDHFRFIVPCGITDRGVTSLARVMDAPPSMAEVEDVVELEMRHVFA